MISVIGGKDHGWARELWHAGTYIFIGGAFVSVFAALTGLFDAWKSSEAGTQARRTINTHATIMVTVTVLALADIAWRLNDYHTERVTPVGIMVLSVVIAYEVVRRTVLVQQQRRVGRALAAPAPAPVAEEVAA